MNLPSPEKSARGLDLLKTSIMHEDKSKHQSSQNLPSFFPKFDSSEINNLLSNPHVALSKNFSTPMTPTNPDPKVQISRVQSDLKHYKTP